MRQRAKWNDKVMTHRQQIIKAAKIGIMTARVAEGAANRGDGQQCKKWIADSEQWADRIISLSDDGRLSRADQVLSIKAGRAVLDFLERKFGRHYETLRCGDLQI